MHKILLKVIIVLFIFSVINQDAFSAPGIYANSIQNPVNVKERAHAHSVVKIVHHTPVISFHSHGFAKPLWAGTLSMPEDGLTLKCTTLFIQNKPHVIYRQQFLRSLLFPFHVFV